MLLGLDTGSYHLAAGLGDWQPTESPLMRLEHFIRKSSELGLESILISNLRLLERTDYGYFSMLRRAALEAGLSIQLGYVGINPGHLQDTVRVAAALGCKRLTFVPTIKRPVAETTLEAKLADVADIIAETLRITARYKVGIVLGGRGLTARELLHIGQMVEDEALSFYLDPLAALSVLECPVEWAQQLGPRLTCAKLCDFRIAWETSGARLSYCTLGEGIVDIPSLLEILQHSAPAAQLFVSTPFQHISLPFLDNLFLESLHHIRPAHITRIVRLLREHSIEDSPMQEEYSEDELLAEEDSRFQESLEWLRASMQPEPSAETTE